MGYALPVPALNWSDIGRMDPPQTQGACMNLSVASRQLPVASYRAAAKGLDRGFARIWLLAIVLLLAAFQAASGAERGREEGTRAGVRCRTEMTVTRTVNRSSV